WRSGGGGAGFLQREPDSDSVARAFTWNPRAAGRPGARERPSRSTRAPVGGATVRAALPAPDAGGRCPEFSVSIRAATATAANTNSDSPATPRLLLRTGLPDRGVTAGAARPPSLDHRSA